MAEHETKRQIIYNKDPVEVYRKIFRIKDHWPTPDYITGIDIDNLPAPDFSHSMHHIETVRNFSKVIAETYGLREDWKSKLDAAVTYHDISQGYTINGLLPTNQHVISSAVIAYMFTGDVKVSNLIYHHNQDILGTSLAFDDERDAAKQILRDADQLSLMGYSGFIRAAYYWGFRHKSMEDDPESILDARVLCDPVCNSDGLPPDYEEKVRMFTLKHLFPFLIETKQVDRAINYARANIERFFDSRRPDENFLDKLKSNHTILESVIKGEQKIPDVWNNPGKKKLFQEIDKRYSYLFIRKALNDYTILNTCRGILFIQNTYEPGQVKKKINTLFYDEGDVSANTRY